MEENKIIPTIEQVEEYLTSYGWKYKTTTYDESKTAIMAPYKFENKDQAILISFRVEGEFVIVSTVGMFLKVPADKSKIFLIVNDVIKLVKVYSVSVPEDEVIDLDLGFELWGESWSKDTFFAFMDMLCLGIERTMEIVEKESIPHETNFLNINPSQQS